MASEKQIAANRRNAKLSTGPKTAAGKLRSSQNAYRHGLSLPLPHNPQIPEATDAIAQMLGDKTDENMGRSAEIAHALFDLSRIRAARSNLMAGLEAACLDPLGLKRLMALDRYEWRAVARRRRASNEL